METLGEGSARAVSSILMGMEEGFLGSLDLDLSKFGNLGEKVWEISKCSKIG